MSEVDDLREVIRQAHEAIKDLRGLLREVKEEKTSMVAMLKGGIDDEIDEHLTVHLNGMQKAFEDSNTAATDAIFKRFDEIYNMLTGKDWETRNRGERSLPEILAHAAHGPLAPSFTEQEAGKK